MKELQIHATTGTSRLLVGAHISDLFRYHDKPPALVLVDERVMSLHEEAFRGLPCMALPSGEASKSLEQIEEIYEAFMLRGIDRSDSVVAVGGGAVCDAVAFAASTYLRGIALSIVPTTLLAQVDAGVGGKNALNFRDRKNIIGTIRQPSVVICDPAFLATLPVPERQNGLAEIIKHGMIADSAYFDFVENAGSRCLEGDTELMEALVYGSLEIKAAIVGRDELDVGERMKLNFGHTIGHAIEAVTGCSHGAAVSIGMAAEAGLSVAYGALVEDERRRLLALLSALGLPTVLRDGDASALKAAMGSDKKRAGCRISIPLIEGIGSSRIISVQIHELEEAIDALCLA